ncbi:MAG: C1 family peptidase [Muribaculaceae bacterium]|nr:C1 family peptidase [Muribaculaceae bacterium]
MKKIILTALILGCLTLNATTKKQPVNPDSTGFKFTDQIIIKDTPVKDQNKTGTCWSFSTCSFYENEILRKTGKIVDLSEMFIVHHCYIDKAIKYIRMEGAINFEQGGSILDVPHVFTNYGAMPDEAYSGLNYGEKAHDHSELISVLKNYMNGLLSSKAKKLTTAWLNGLNGIIDAYLGTIPATFTHQGKEYTPASYSQSLGLNFDDYIPMTSFTHHKFYEPFIMEVADNWIWGEYYNLPIDELKAVVDNALNKGYSVSWAADVTEGGFQWKNGYAIFPKEKSEADMDSTELKRWSKLLDKDRESEKYIFDSPVPEINVTQELRQEMFDNHETTDDHLMLIIGTAIDQDGNKYYKVKNSWNTNQIYDGYLYVSEQYFKAKTITILVNKEAIPKATYTKLK